MTTASSGAVAVQLIQGVQRVDLEVQDLKGRVSRVESRMGRLEVRMGKLEASNGQILRYVKRIAKMLAELPSLGKTHGSTT
jgi:hypothetical protein